MSKPYHSGVPCKTEDRAFKEEDLEPSPVATETSDTRSKRQVLPGRRFLCPGRHPPPPPSSQARPHPCVKAMYFCPMYNLTEAECNPMSLRCLNRIETHGYPKCEPVLKNVTITLSNGQKKKLTIAKDCRCAQSSRANI